MRLYITEKGSYATKLAQALGSHRSVSIDKSTEGYRFGGHKAGDGWIVAPLRGHMYRLLEPHEVDPKWKRWRLETLPIVHKHIDWTINDSGGPADADKLYNQVEHIRGFYPKTTELVLATDGDQEGQVIGDVFLQRTGWRGPVKRLWTKEWEASGLKRALSNLQDNAQYQGHFAAGLARVFLDQVVGFNLTRLYTLKAQQAGYNLVANTGRVRSVCCAIVVDWQRRVEAHVARSYFGIEGQFGTPEATLKAELQMPEGLLEDGKHCFDEASVNQLLNKLREHTHVRVLSVDSQNRQTPPPRPLSQNTLSQLCSDRFGMLPKSVIQASQWLYEQGHISYPRTEADVFELDVLSRAPGIIGRIERAMPEIGPMIERLDLDHPQPVFSNELGEQAHCAIFPTEHTPSLDKLSEDQRRVYETIVRRLLVQFAPDMATAHSKMHLGAGEHRFEASSRVLVYSGWSAVEPQPSDEKPPLPSLSVGDECDIISLDKSKKTTKAPPRLTVKMFQHILEDCTDYLSPRVKQLIGTGQLGTGATQPYYLDELVNQGVAQVEQGKYLVPTKRGRLLRDLWVDEITSADMTALWEHAFRGIREGSESAGEFMDKVLAWVSETVHHGKENLKVPPSPTITPCPQCESAMTRRSPGKGANAYWRCTGCSMILPDMKARPAPVHEKHGQDCPRCQSMLVTRVRRKAPMGVFLGCSSRECRYSED